MRFIFLLLVSAFSIAHLQAQTWTDEQIKSANTADNISQLTEEEQEVFLYLNLARMYPKEFIQIELENEGVSDKYLISLKQNMRTIKPLKPINWNLNMQNLAECYSEEQSKRGTIGHKRQDCPQGFNAECVSYGMHGGRDIVLQLLIDRNVPDYGHREICFRSDLAGLGVSANDHPVNTRCCVLDFLFTL